MGACGGAGCPVLGSSKEEVTDERCSGSDYAALPSVCSSLTPDRSLTLAELVDGISAVLHASKQKPLDTLLCLGQMLRCVGRVGLGLML